MLRVLFCFLSALWKLGVAAKDVDIPSGDKSSTWEALGALSSGFQSPEEGRQLRQVNFTLEGLASPEADERVIRIVEPWDGMVSHGATVVLRLEIVDASEVAQGGMIAAKAAADDAPMRMGQGVRVLTLNGVEAGTHHVQVSLTSVHDGALIGEAEVLWDNVFPPGELVNHRVLSYVERSGRTPSPLQEERTPLPLSLQSQSHPRTRLCFVTSLKLDGQRMIYLQQLQRLPRDKYDMVVLNMQRPGREEDGRVFQDRLAELEVPLLRSDGLSVSIKDAEAALGVGNVTEDAVVTYALKCLAENQGLIDDRGPPWVRHVFESLAQTIRGIAPDILVFANGRTPSDALLAVAARLAGVKHVVMELPNLFPFVPMREVDVLIAPSHYAAGHHSVQALLKETIARTGKAPQVMVINPGVDEARFHPLRSAAAASSSSCHSMCLRLSNSSEKASSMECNPDCVVIAFVGRLDPEKSPGLFLHMAALVLEDFPTARFQVIGYGPLRVPLERRARALGMGPDVMSFAGALYEDLPRVLRTVGVLVNPSLRAWSETFCIVNVEAMASGVPVVSYGVGGTGEYLHDGVNSILVEGHDSGPQPLADAVLGLLRDPAKRQRLALEARRTVLEQFTVVQQIEFYDKLYSSLLQRDVDMATKST